MRERRRSTVEYASASSSSLLRSEQVALGIIFPSSPTILRLETEKTGLRYPIWPRKAE
jgi:hypothetical protein